METVVLALAILVILVAGYFLLVFCVGTVVIKNSVDHSGDIRFLTYDPNLQPPHPLVLEEINRGYHALAPRGFELVAYLFQEGQVPGAMSYVTLMRNPETRDGAAIITLRSESSPAPAMVTNYIEFSTEYTDGEEMNTNNSKVALGTHYSRPGKRGFQFPGIRDAAELYRCHQDLCEGLKSGSKVMPPAPAEAVGELVKAMKKDLEYQVECGLLYHDPALNRYRFTWRGAVRGVALNVFPFLQIRTRLRQRRDLKTLERIRGEKESSASAPSVS